MARIHIETIYIHKHTSNGVVGGPVVGPGCPTVLIGGMPAAVMGDMCICVGPPDSIILGSTGVMIGGKPAARMGDSCAHGGAIILGCPTVLIGEVSPGSPSPLTMGALAGAAAELKKSVAQIMAMMEAAENGVPLIEPC